MNVLVLKSSILADNSQSNKLADYTIEKLKDQSGKSLFTHWKEFSEILTSVVESAKILRRTWFAR